ncbi:MAG: RNA-binding S4 domain-containing protein [Candidatus Zixiibacteriota bacterium]|nr:MAG: RNA-binding S4 domain-containing protein [candidate division Zixibacteria bacterium]
MRIDDYLSTVGVIKRRTIAKKLADSKMIDVNGKSVKASYQVKEKDIIQIKGTQGKSVEVLMLPTSSVPKTDRERYFKELN